MPTKLKPQTKRPKSPPPGRGTGTDGRGIGLGADLSGVQAGDGGGRGGELDGKLVVQRRHVDWLEHQIRWRWLLDSHEGGERYRNAVYGPDRKGLPCRNLFRHRREYPDSQQFPVTYQGFAGYMSNAGAPMTQDVMYGPYPGMLGADPAATAQDDDYEQRRSRTPVPDFLNEVVGIHVAKLYSQEVKRKGPADLEAWWKDVDGRGTPIADWMRNTIAPLLLVLGNIDIVLDHPKAPPGVTVMTRRDEIDAGLDRCVASYIMPENMVWYRLDAAGRYVECLVREYANPADMENIDENGNVIDPSASGDLGQDWRRNYVRFRLWNARESVLYSFDGDEVLERIPHPFGCVPIVRLVDLPRLRTPNVGKPRYEVIAEYQREYYNRDSELILSDTLQAHPYLSGAEDFCKSDNTLSVGPGYVLPMKKNPETGTYQGWEYVTPSKDPAESLRRNKQDIRDAVDRAACLTKPAGAASSGGTGASTVSQSGFSKQLDAHSGHMALSSISLSTAKAERQVAEFAAMVLRNAPLAPAERAQIEITYPARWELYSAEDLATLTTAIQKVLEAVGNAPRMEQELLQSTVRQALPGLTEAIYELLDAEIQALCATRSRLAEQAAEMAVAGVTSQAEAMEGEGSAEAGGGEDPTGQSGGTAVSNIIPSTM